MSAFDPIGLRVFSTCRPVFSQVKSYKNDSINSTTAADGDVVTCQMTNCPRII